MASAAPATCSSFRFASTAFSTAPSFAVRSEVVASGVVWAPANPANISAPIPSSAPLDLQNTVMATSLDLSYRLNNTTGSADRAERNNGCYVYCVGTDTLGSSGFSSSNGTSIQEGNVVALSNRLPLKK